ncbi:MAG TPA: fused MFS/spermidine synthase [Polyangiaceae bacterium]|jgi:spermidine synthase
MRLLPIAFASGACALVYQVGWTRDFRMIFGASTPASAAVVAVFVGGLGLGAWTLSPRVDRAANPVRLYARLELGVALSAAVSPLLLLLVTRLYLLLGGTVSLGAAGAAVARLLLTALVLGLPTFLMGGTLPALARGALSRGADPSRRQVGLLYGANTLGAVLGCLVANFLLLERLGTRATLWAAAAANVLLALAALAMSRGAGVDGPTDPLSPVIDLDPPETGARRVNRVRVLGSAAVAGFAFFLMELVFYRMLAPLLGGTIYTFGLVLAVALLGIGLGGALYALVFRRRAPDLGSLAAICLLEALLLALPYALGDRVALLTILLRPPSPESLASYLPGWLAVTALVVLPGAIASGVQFPLLVALLGRGRRRVGRDVGLAYAWNAAGAIAGAIAGGFGLMPLLTAPGCWRFAVGVLSALGIAAAVLHWRQARALRSALVQGLQVAAVAVLMLLSLGPTAAWRHAPIGAGRIEPSRIDTTASALSFVRNERRDIAWEADGIESTVALDRNGGYSFSVNGKSDGHCSYDAGTQVMGGLLGALLHPAPKSALIVGLGSGSSAGWLARVPGIERVDVVELEPAMLEVARRCAPVNEHALDNPRLHVVLGDAREVLSVTRARYDVIFSEPSNPYRAGVASLYTREYYARVRERLAEGGIFLQWVQGYEIDTSTMRTIFATLASELPYVEAWQLEEPDLVLVASRSPIPKQVPALRARIASEPFARALHLTWRVDDLEGLLAHFVARAAMATRIAGEWGEPLNTDDRCIAEFGFARGMAEIDRHPARVTDVRSWAAEHGEDVPELTAGEVDWDRVALERAEIPCAYKDDPPYETPAGASDDTRERLDFVAAGAESGRPDEKHREAWLSRPRDNPTPIERRYAAEAFLEAGAATAPAWIDGLATTDPLDASVLRARWLDDQKRPAEATAELEGALVAARADPWMSNRAMSQALRLAMKIAYREPSLEPRIAAMLAQPFAIDAMRDRRLNDLISIAQGSRDFRACAAAYREMEPNAPWSTWQLEERIECYQGVGDYARAADASKELERWKALDGKWWGRWAL